MNIMQVPGGRFISGHIGATVYHDSRHRLIKSKLEGGVIGERKQRVSQPIFIGRKGDHRIMTISEANYWAGEFSDEQLDAEADIGVLLLVAERILPFLVG
jgi:hypothetical protein